MHRRNISFNTSKVNDVLPSYYATEYGEDSGSLIKFLDLYYDALDSTGALAFKSEINNLFSVRDIQDTTTSALDKLISEIGNGLTASSFFQNPRLMAKLLSGFYRAKGTLNSAEGFFRGFFNEDVTVEYPKKQIFIVGESNIGWDDQKFIQDDAIFQIFSILVKTGLSTVDYEALYKRFVHPAGFHFAGQVLTQTEAELGILAESSQPLFDSDPALRISNEAVIGDTVTGAFAPFTELTGLIDSNGTTKDYRVRLDLKIDIYQTLTLQQIANTYTSIPDILNPNSFKLDDSGYNNFGYNGYPGEDRGWEGPPTNFLVDSPAHENVFYVMNGAAPYQNLNVAATTYSGDKISSIYWNSTSPFRTPPAASALLGEEALAINVYIDWTDNDFDSSKFVNPEHLVGKDMSSATNRSKFLPGTLVRGSVFSPAQPEYYFRVDSDAYYYDDDNYPVGYFVSNQGLRFSVSKLRWQGKDSAAPDFSLDVNFETFDNDAFDSYNKVGFLEDSI